MSDQFEDALDMVAGEATVKESLPVDWMKLALTVVWNFPSHPGSHPKDRSDEMYDEDPVTAWRDGWIAAVDALHAAVRDVTPAGNAILAQEDITPAELSAALAQQAEPVRCWCESCDMAANGGLRTRMSVCPSCGDKRCQRAAHHDNPCSA